MIQICSVCKIKYGEKEPFEDTRFTHGYCQECYAVVMAELDNYPANGATVTTEATVVRLAATQNTGTS